MPQIETKRLQHTVQFDVIDTVTDPIACRIDSRAREALVKMQTRPTRFSASLARVADLSQALEGPTNLEEETLDTVIESLTTNDEHAHLLDALMESAATNSLLPKADEFALMSLIAQIYDERSKDFKAQVRTYLDLRQEELSKIADNTERQGRWATLGAVGSMVLKTWAANTSMMTSADLNRASSVTGINITSWQTARQALLFQTPGEGGFRLGALVRLDRTLKALVLKTITLQGSQNRRQEAAKGVFETWGNTTQVGADWKTKDEERLKLLHQGTTDRYKQNMDMAQQDEANAQQQGRKTKEEIDQAMSKRDQSQRSVVQGIRGG